MASYSQGYAGWLRSVRAATSADAWPHLPIRAPIVLAVVLLLAVNLVVAAFMAIAHAEGIRLGILFRDPASQFGIPHYAGVFSFAGILALVAAAAVCLFATLLVPRSRLLLGFVGAFSGLMAIDDLFMIHEWFMPDILGVPQAAFVAIYPALAAALVLALGWQVASTRFLLLWASLVLLGTGVAVDLVLDIENRLIDLLAEDHTKFCGFLLWSVFWASYAHAAVRATQAPAGGGIRPGLIAPQSGASM